MSVLVVKPKQVRPADKKQLKEMGIVVIEADDPESVRFIEPEYAVPHSDMLYAALKSLSGDSFGNRQAEFVRLLLASMKPSP